MIQGRGFIVSENSERVKSLHFSEPMADLPSSSHRTMVTDISQGVPFDLGAAVGRRDLCASKADKCEDQTAKLMTCNLTFSADYESRPTTSASHDASSFNHRTVGHRFEASGLLRLTVKLNM